MDIVSLIKKDKIEKAIEASLDIVENLSLSTSLSLKDLDQVHSLLINLSSRMNRINQEKRNGIISNDEYFLNRNKIANSLIEVSGSVIQAQKTEEDSSGLKMQDYKSMRSFAQSWRPYRRKTYDFFVFSEKDDGIVKEVSDTLLAAGLSVFNFNYATRLTQYSTIEEGIESILLDTQALIIINPDKARKIGWQRLILDHYYGLVKSKKSLSLKIYFLSENEENIGFDSEPYTINSLKVINVKEIINDFSTLLPLFKNVGKEQKKELRIEKIVIEKDNVKLIKCPSCNSDVKKEEIRIDRLVTASFSVTILLTAYYASSFDPLKILGIFILCLIPGVLISFILLYVLQTASNKFIIDVQPVCENCGYQFRLREIDQKNEVAKQEVLYEDQKEGDAQPSFKHVYSYLKENDYPRALDELLLFFKVREEEWYGEQVKEIEDNLWKLENEKTSGIISSADYTQGLVNIYSDTQRVINDYKEFQIDIKSRLLSKEFAEKSNKLIVFLEEIGMKKYYSLMTKAGYGFSSLVVIEKEKLVQIGMSPGDSEELIRQVNIKKQEAYPKVLFRIFALVLLGITSWFILYREYFHFSFLDENVGASVLAQWSQILSDFSIFKFCLFALPFTDVITGSSMLVIGGIILIVLLLHRVVLKGNVLADGIQVVLWIIMIFFVLALVISTISFLIVTIHAIVSCPYDTMEPCKLSYLSSHFSVWFWLRLIPPIAGVFLIKGLTNTKTIFD